MAKATIKTQPVVQSVILELSESEANHLLSVIGRIIPSDFTEEYERKEVNAAIYQALREAGLDPLPLSEQHLANTSRARRTSMW